MDMEIEGALCFTYANLLFTAWPHPHPTCFCKLETWFKPWGGTAWWGPCPYLASGNLVEYPKQMIMKENKEKRTSMEWQWRTQCGWQRRAERKGVREGGVSWGEWGWKSKGLGARVMFVLSSAFLYVVVIEINKTFSISPSVRVKALCKANC